MSSTSDTIDNEKLNLNIINRVAMGDMLRRRARSDRNREAIVEIIGGNRRAISYFELNSQVNRIVHGMRAKGLRQASGRECKKMKIRKKKTFLNFMTKIGILTTFSRITFFKILSGTMFFG